MVSPSTLSKSSPTCSQYGWGIGIILTYAIPALWGWCVILNAADSVMIAALFLLVWTFLFFRVVYSVIGVVQRVNPRFISVLALLCGSLSCLGHNLALSGLPAREMAAGAVALYSLFELAGFLVFALGSQWLESQPERRDWMFDPKTPWLQWSLHPRYEWALVVTLGALSLFLIASEVLHLPTGGLLGLLLSGFMLWVILSPTWTLALRRIGIVLAWCLVNAALIPPWVAATLLIAGAWTLSGHHAPLRFQWVHPSIGALGLAGLILIALLGHEPDAFLFSRLACIVFLLMGAGLAWLSHIPLGRMPALVWSFTANTSLLILPALAHGSLPELVGTLGYVLLAWLFWGSWIQMGMLLEYHRQRYVWRFPFKEKLYR